MGDMIQRCAYCGTELTDGIPVCPHCGRDNSVPVLGGKKRRGSGNRRGSRSASRSEYSDEQGLWSEQEAKRRGAGFFDEASEIEEQDLYENQTAGRIRTWRKRQQKQEPREKAAERRRKRAAGKAAESGRKPVPAAVRKKKPGRGRTRGHRAASTLHRLKNRQSAAEEPGTAEKRKGKAAFFLFWQLPSFRLSFCVS